MCAPVVLVPAVAAFAFGTGGSAGGGGAGGNCYNQVSRAVAVHCGIFGIRINAKHRSSAHSSSISRARARDVNPGIAWHRRAIVSIVSEICVDVMCVCVFVSVSLWVGVCVLCSRVAD